MRVGIIGGGNISETHARAARAVEGATVAAIYGANPDRTAQLAAEFGAAPYHDLDQFLDHGLDLVIIGSPSGRHAEQGIAAARRGLHVLVEKPIDITTARIDALLEEVDRAGVRLGVCFQDRLHPDIHATKALIDAGTLGTPVLASGRVKWYRPPEYYAGSRWRGTWQLDGGGALINQAIHTVDLLLWMFGPVSRVYATTATRVHAIEVEDTAAAVLEFENGALGTIEAATSVYPGYPRRLELTGSHGTIVIEHDRVVRSDLRSGGADVALAAGTDANASASSATVSDSRAHQRIIADFLQAIETGARPVCDGAEGRRSVALVEAIYTSARTHQPLTLAPVNAAAAFLLILITAAAALAHPAPFSHIDVRMAGDGLRGRLVLHDLDVAHDLGLPSPDPLASDAGVGPHAGAIVRLMAARFELSADGAVVPWAATVVSALPDRNAVEIEWFASSRPPGRLGLRADIFPYDRNHQTFVNVYEGAVLVRQEVLNHDRQSLDLFTGTRQGLLAVFSTFTISGIHHIAIGPDHILFIVGLLLLGGSMRRLLAIVTAFTLGHSVTLALATLRIVDPPAQIVEPAIALSIVYVGADNLLVGRSGRDVRAWVALFFGLVHGFGFASVLREQGLPPRALPLSLFSFNLGVEIGQAAIVLAVAAALAALRRRNPSLAAQVATGGSVCVVLAGAYWFVQRVFYSGTV